MVKKIAIVSLSRGIIGDSKVKHEVDIGLKRLEDYGISVMFMPNALKDNDYLSAHPEARANDLLNAFKDESIDMIFCAIGGDDTYRLLPYLFENDELKKVVNNKIFLGFSDTTINHFMLNKVGLNTFYGQSFFADTCELDCEMLPYSRHYFEELIKTGTISKITPSDVWYEDRTDWSKNAIGVSRNKHMNDGFELIQGKHIFSGEIFGGCIESIFDMFDNTRYSDTTVLCDKYKLFPSLDFWKRKILLLETSEEADNVDHYRYMLETIKKTGIFSVVNGIICGKPINNRFYHEFQQIIKDVIDNPDLPILTNVSVGHCTPRCIIPFGIKAIVDSDKQEITFVNK